MKMKNEWKNESNDTSTESYWKHTSEATAPPRQKLLSCSLQDFLEQSEARQLG